MNTRQEWLNNTDYTSQFYSAEETINEVKENFDIRRYYSAEGADVIVDGIECRALVQYFTNPLNQAKYDRKLHVTMDINISTGSIVDYDGYKWLVTGSIDDIQAYKTAGMVKSNNTLTIHKNNTSYQIPCIISKSLSLSTEDNQYIETVDNELFLTVSKTLITLQIDVNDIYEIGLHNYYISSVADDISNPGLLIFKMKYSEVEQEEHVYTLTILNGTTIDIQESTTLQLNINVYDNGILVSSTPNLTFTSSDETICTVNSSGLVTSLNNIDNCDITVSLSSDSSIFKSININVIEVPQDNYTVIISGTNSIIKGYTCEFSATFMNNGIEYSEQSEFYLVSDDGISSTTLAQIISQDNVTNTCVVKGLGIGYVKLFVRNLDDSIVSDGFRIQIKNLF